MRTNAPEAILAIAGDAASRITIENGVVDTSALTDADLTGNEGALLLHNMASSKVLYTYTENPTAQKAVSNLNRLPDELRFPKARYPNGKPSDALPPAGVDSAVTVNPSVRWIPDPSVWPGQQWRVVGTKQVAFHELAEAYATVEPTLAMGYLAAHRYSAQLEITRLMVQRPWWTPFPAGLQITQLQPEKRRK